MRTAYGLVALPMVAPTMPQLVVCLQGLCIMPSDPPRHVSWLGFGCIANAVVGRELGYWATFNCKMSTSWLR
jgi:hypothetical protein